MKGLSSREMKKAIKAYGWYLVSVRGDHEQYKHPEKPGKVTIVNGKERLSLLVIKGVMKQSGLTEQELLAAS